MKKKIYVGIYQDGGEEYELRSDECKPQDQCGDSDWWFHRRSKTFKRYYTYYHELYGTQTVNEEVVASLLEESQNN